jgi:hypothetical protein
MFGRQRINEVSAFGTALFAFILTRIIETAETVHMSLVRILMAVFDISHELEGYLLF